MARTTLDALERLDEGAERSSCRPGRAPRWSGSSGPSCSRWSAITTPRLEPARSASARRSFSEFLLDRVPDAAATAPDAASPASPTTTRATCCASSASRTQPRRAARRGRGCERVPWSADERCCGFGGHVLVQAARDVGGDGRRQAARRSPTPAPTTSWAPTRRACSTCAARAEHEGRPVAYPPHRRGRWPTPWTVIGGHRLTGYDTAPAHRQRERTTAACADERLRTSLEPVERFADGRAAALADARRPRRRSAAAARRSGPTSSPTCPTCSRRFADNVHGRGGHVHWADDARRRQRLHHRRRPRATASAPS